MTQVKVKKRKCEDGKTREFVRRKVQFVEIWNTTLRQYAEAGKEWNTATVEGDTPKIQFYEGMLAGYTATIHILRHFRDGDVFELPKDIPKYLELEGIEEELKEDLDNKFSEKGNK